MLPRSVLHIAFLSLKVLTMPASWYGFAITLLASVIALKAGFVFMPGGPPQPHDMMIPLLVSNFISGAFGWLVLVLMARGTASNTTLPPPYYAAMSMAWLMYWAIPILLGLALAVGAPRLASDFPVLLKLLEVMIGTLLLPILVTAVARARGDRFTRPYDAFTGLPEGAVAWWLAGATIVAVSRFALPWARSQLLATMQINLEHNGLQIFALSFVTAFGPVAVLAFAIKAAASHRHNIQTRDTVFD